jgi:hypothetical protein
MSSASAPPGHRASRDRCFASPSCCKCCIWSSRHTASRWREPFAGAGARAGEPGRRVPHLIVVQEARQALRLFRRQPGVTLVAALRLAVGIGANTALFSTVDAVLLRPLPYPGADRLVDVSETLNTAVTAVSPINFFDWQALSRSFERMSLYIDDTTTLTGPGGTEQLTSCQAGSALFPTLRVQPAIGRNFGAEEDRSGLPNVAIIGDALWKRRFGADPNVVGSKVRFDSEPYEMLTESLVLSGPRWDRRPSAGARRAWIRS